MGGRERLSEEEVIAQAVSVFERVRNVPFVMGLDGDPRKLFEENVGNCTRKGLYLASELRKLGYNTLLGFASFDWREMPIPSEISSILKDPIDTHLFLFVNRGGKEMVVDASWDLGMPPGFVKNKWDGKSSTEIGVKDRKFWVGNVNLFVARMVMTKPLASVKGILRPNTPTPFNNALNEWLGRTLPKH